MSVCQLSGHAKCMHCAVGEWNAQHQKHKPFLSLKGNFMNNSNKYLCIVCSSCAVCANLSLQFCLYNFLCKQYWCKFLNLQGTSSVEFSLAFTLPINLSILLSGKKCGQEAQFGTGSFYGIKIDLTVGFFFLRSFSGMQHINPPVMVTGY